jgi:uncharacterized protein YjaG (DUF416 family)
MAETLTVLEAIPLVFRSMRDSEMIPRWKISDIYQVLRRCLRSLKANKRRDLELINAAADQLNREAEDVLGYQSSAQS